MTTTTSTKTFTLAQMLSITTGRLCCDMDGIYEILNHVTGDNLFTHVLPRARRFAAPLLLKAHPELQPANACLSNLDKWIAADKTERKTECIKIWLAELKIMFPAMDKPFAVESYGDSWLSLDPISEPEGMVGKGSVSTVIK